MNAFLFSLLQLIYPLPEANHTRDRPLQVLALGISRSATESLRQALKDLGYADVHHGFRFILQTDECLQWIRIAHAQQNGDTRFLTAAQFDKVIGDCEAVTDQPSCGFAHDLLTAYPEAKVILNYRADVEAWHASVNSTVEGYNASWYDYLLTFFQPEMFWHQRTFYWLWRRHFDSDFQRNGRKWYREHYHNLEARLQREGRQFLWWKVEDGWKPLCEFLGEDVPRTDFPSGNAPKEYEEKMGMLYLHRRAEAERNLKIAAGVMVAVVSCVAWYLYMR